MALGKNKCHVPLICGSATQVREILSLPGGTKSGFPKLLHFKSRIPDSRDAADVINLVVGGFRVH